MPDYRRLRYPGGIYFFTVNLADRQNDLLIREIARLRHTIRDVRDRHPFEIVAAVILPEHLHMIWSLPMGDDDFSTRWGLIKAGFSRGIDSTERRSASRSRKGERGIWQRRFYDHLCRDEQDLENHIHYIHYNPVKHGLVERPADWPHSSIHQFIRRGHLSADWGTSTAPIFGDLEYDCF
jgi:putative transposase